MRIIVVLLSLALSSFFLLTAQENQWENITSHQSATKRIDDGNFSYMATSGGLVVRDWTTNEDVFYNRGNSPLPSIVVNDIALDAEGTLWISTYAGTVRYKNGEFLENAWSSLGTWTEPLTDDQAMILAGVSALFVFDWEGNVSEYPLPFFSADPPIPVTDAANETLYLGLINYFAPSGVVRFKDGQWLEDGESMIASNYYYSLGLVLSADGELWLAGDKLMRIDGDEIVEEIDYSELQDDLFGPVWLKEDHLGNLWLLMAVQDDSILFEKQGDDWILTDRNTLTDEQETSLFGLPALMNVDESPLENNRVV
ncbi:hypothetical protein N8482_02635, partial [Chitinophagales bacterium]|nr:hypothetical protein [Chitinophagales bacterium]